jgi:2-polyprenyl-3-methyl-5-hydroxy-6-metoxy-1,4-benzoquinol methylase
VAREKGVEIITAFLSEGKAQEILRQYGPFDGVIGLNVVPHTPDFTSLLRGVHSLLKPGGTFFMECAYVLNTIL